MLLHYLRLDVVSEAGVTREEVSSGVHLPPLLVPALHFGRLGSIVVRGHCVPSAHQIRFPGFLYEVRRRVPRFKRGLHQALRLLVLYDVHGCLLDHERADCFHSGFEVSPWYLK